MQHPWPGAAVARTGKEALMIVLGVDPGVRSCGLAVLYREEGSPDPWRAWSVKTVRTSAKESLHERLRTIWDAIACGISKTLTVEALGEQTVVAVEEQSGASEGARRRGETNADALLVQQVVGLARAATFGDRGDLFVEVTPAEAKRVLIGMTMTASKAQVQRAIRAVVGGCPTVMSEHASDAVAIALAGARKARGLPVLSLKTTRRR